MTKSSTATAPTRFQITPVLTDNTGKEAIASNAIAVGSMSAVDEFRNTLTAPDQIKSLKQKLATAEAATAKAVADVAKWKSIADANTVSAPAFWRANDTLTNLRSRMDQWEQEPEEEPEPEPVIFPPGYTPEIQLDPELEAEPEHTTDEDEPYQPQQAFPEGGLHVVEAKHDRNGHTNGHIPAADETFVLSRSPPPRGDPQIGSKAGEQNLQTAIRLPLDPAEKDKH